MSTFWTLIPLGWHQRVPVTVRNTDSQAGQFEVTVQLNGPATQTLQQSKAIGAGQAVDYLFKFDIPNRKAYDASFEVSPEMVVIPCPSCQGMKQFARTCPACQGSGKVQQSTTVTDPCPTCKGAKSMPCSKCNGTGRVKRFGG